MAEQEKPSWSNILSIPGNIRQQYLPFVLIGGFDEKDNKRTSSYTKRFGNSLEIGSAGNGAQYFSFKFRDIDQYKHGYGRLNICPSSYTSPEFARFFQEDISFRTLFSSNTQGSRSKDEITVQKLFDSTPSIQIREYLPDTRIDQLLNFTRNVVDLMELAAGGTLDAFSSAFGEGQKEGAKKNESWIKNLFNSTTSGLAAAQERLAENMVDTISWLCGTLKYKQPNGEPSFWKEYKNETKEMEKLFAPAIYTSDKHHSMLDIPFFLYYKIQSYVTTNIYELPCKIEQAFDLDGAQGWKGAAEIPLENNFLGKMLKNIPGIGNTLTDMFKNVRINYMSSWDPASGQGVTFPVLNVKFSLFNDTLESALINYVFINTIAPGNMWVQDGLIQHSGSVYDVKVEGHSRMFMCTGQVKVSFKGALRDPSDYFLGELIRRHLNPNVEDQADSIVENRLIKIPDVYEVELVFKSMFPSNFNNYMFQFVYNKKMDTAYATGNAYYGGILHGLNTVLDKKVKMRRQELAKQTAVAAAAKKAETEAEAKQAQKNLDKAQDDLANNTDEKKKNELKQKVKDAERAKKKADKAAKDAAEEANAANQNLGDLGG